MKTLSTVLGALGIFLWVFLLGFACYTLNNGEGFLFWKRKLKTRGKHAGEERVGLNWPGVGGFLWCLLGAAVPTAVYVLLKALTTTPWWLALIYLLAMLALMVNIPIWWNHKVGARWFHIIPHLLILGMYTTLALSAAEIVAAAIAIPFWAKLVGLVPVLTSTFSSGFMWWTMFFCWSEEAESEHPTLWKVLGWVAVGITALAMLLTIILNLVSLPKREVAPVEPPVTPQQTEQPAAPAPTKWYWYHDDVLADNYDETGAQLTGEALAEALLNDYNFGTDLVHEAVMRKLNAGKISYADIIACKSEEELATKGLLSVDDVKAVYYERLMSDPTQLAASAAWYDVTFHTDFLGEFMVNYEGQEERWMKIINHAAEWWAENPTAFYQAADRFVQELEHCNEIRLRYIAGGITDQMYMDGMVPGEMPRVIVMKSPDQSGWVIEFVKIIKGNAHVAGYRTTCGGQPYNVAEILGVTPQENPTKPSPKQGGGNQGQNGGGQQQNHDGGGQQGQNGGGKPADTTGGGTPPSGGGGTPPITDPKDPSRGTPVLPNDDPGIKGDPPTMDPNDPWHSTAEKPMNSGNGMTTNEYFDLNNDAKEAEDVANRHADGPDTSGHYRPTYQPTPVEQSEGGVEVHSNDDTGKDGIGGGIDTAAPVDNNVTGEVLNSNGEPTGQTADTQYDGDQPHWGADMSR